MPEKPEDISDFDALKNRLKSLTKDNRQAGTNTNKSIVSQKGSIDLAPFANVDSLNYWPLQLDPYFFGHYVFGDIVGRGSYAQVRECIDLNSLERFAVKVVDMRYLKKVSEKLCCNQIQEIKILKNLNHENIICLKECVYETDRIYMVMEYCSLTLQQIIEAQGGKTLDWPIVRNIFSQLIAGLEYIHSFGIVHRDIKPQNLLINQECKLKIIDFGVSQVLHLYQNNSQCSNYEGSPLYQAPEVVAGHKNYDGYKVDVWSSGVTLYFLSYGKHPFEDGTLLGLYDKILADEPIFPQRKSCQVLNDLLATMLEKTASRRSDIGNIKSHPWLSLNKDFSSNNLIEISKQVLTHAINDPNYSARLKKVDVYRSISVLPYLYAHHHPSQKIFKYRQQSKSSTQASNSSSAVNTILSNVSSSTNSTIMSDSSSADGNISSDSSPEWVSEEEYHLMKIPPVRANRVRAKEYKLKQSRTNKEFI